MLLYTDIVNKALNREVLPLMQRMVDMAVSKDFGANWYEIKGKEILSKSENFNAAENKIASSGLRPIDAMDLTSILFLLSPFEKIGNSIQQLDGFMGSLQDFMGFEDWQVRRINRIRVIRNNVAHDRVDLGDSYDQNAILNGLSEKKWLNELEEILKFFNGNASLFDYQKTLMEEIAEEKKKAASTAGTSAANATTADNDMSPTAMELIQATEELRPEIRKIFPFEFLDAKLQQPSGDPAPWVVDNRDLSDLPWPSQVLETQKAEENKTANNHSSNAQSVLDQYKDTFDNIDKKLDETVEKTVETLSKGINSLINRFKK